MSNAALIVAAGKGARLGAPLPKQYLPLGDGTVLRHTVKAFLDHPGIDRVQVVIAEPDAALYQSSVGDLPLLPPAIGGATRQESVRRGLEALADSAPACILIHDAARPFVGPSTIDAVLDAISSGTGALPVLPLVDSIKVVDQDSVTGSVDRDTLGRAQTPQGFVFKEILTAHRESAHTSLTDDVEVFQQSGLRVVAVPGDPGNVKITTTDDLDWARQRLASGPAVSAEEFRVGQGFDVHRFAAGRPLMLCGIDIPHERGLAGHSDADVALHALTDAILGAIADGDIGDHFPPDNAEWRGAPSDLFLRFAADRVEQMGGRIASVDLTIICEAPKIKPHRAAMRDRLSGILRLDANRISVKATTTEKLGFTGRREGIAAQASVSVALPREP